MYSTIHIWKKWFTTIIQQYYLKKTTFKANGFDILQQLKNKPKTEKFEEQFERT